MADEKEKVLYEFQGDVSSLKKSTQDAMGHLDKFQGTMDKVNAEGIVKASQRAQAGFQNSVNRITKSIADVQKKLNTVGDVRMPRGTEAFNATKQATETLASTLNKLNSSNTITTKGLNELKAGLNAAAAGLKSAGPSFDTLVAKEEKFQQRLATIGSVANKFASTLYGATDKVKGTFSAMGTAVGAKLGALGAKFEPVVTKLQGFKDKAAIAGNRVAQVFDTVASAFRRTSDGTEDASRSQSKFSKAIDGIKEKLSNHKKKLKETSDEYKGTESASQSATDKMQANANALASSMGAVKNVVGGIKDSFFALAGVQVGDAFADGAKSAIDYVENLNLFNVAMGSSVDKGNAFVNKMQEVYGMDPSNLYKYSGYFYQLTDAIGMSEAASATMSLSMTKAANDLASLFNMDVQTVVDDLSSGMQGMSRSVRKYGMDIRATTLQQTALKYGIDGEVESMSEANRQALRYITMLEQSQNALHQTTNATDGTSTEMGDFARNIESPANQLRIFKEQMSQLGRAFGNFIIAPLQRALPYINGFVMALRTLLNFLAKVMGVSVKAGSSLSSAGDSAKDAAAGVSSIGNAADKASKKLNQMTAPFDELNVFQESSGDDSGSGALISDDALDPALAAALEGMSLNLEDISMKANKVRDDVLGFLGLTVSTDPITGEEIIQWDREAFMANVMGSLNAFKNWFTNLSPLTTGIVTIAGVVGGLIGIGSIATKVTQALPALSSALNVVKVGFSLLTSPIGLIIIALVALLAFSEDFRGAFIKLFSKVGKSLEEWGGILSGVFSTVGTDLSAMWDTHIQPTISAIGSALAPALETLGALWDNLSVIVSDIFLKIGNLWTTVLKPVMEGALSILQDLANMFKRLWEEYVGPVIEYIGNGIQDLWTSTFSPVMDKVIGLLGDFWELVMALWNNVLGPLINWLISTLGPKFKEVFISMWDRVKPIVKNIGDAVGGLVDVFRGVIQFLTGVFSGDWQKAWEGVKKIFEGIWETISNVVKVPINVILGFINAFIDAIENALNWLIDGINKFSFKVPDWVPEIGGKKFGFNLSKVSLDNIPYLAKGGVVTGPTPAMIGEGKYDEMVMPLGDSPQMNDFIDRIVDTLNNNPGPGTSPVEVRVFIGDKEFDAYTYKASERGKKIVGKQPIKIGG